MNYFFVIVMYEKGWFFYYVMVYINDEIGMFNGMVYKVVVW